ncbi:TPA: DUF1275 domain-containing protein [Morganella morganii subsp. morganii]|nr:DUF1275 domain-containing protein [Morganella morganii subsp. morganii]
MNSFSDLKCHTHLSFFLLLCFTGGFVDAGSFVIFEVFTGHLTGNSVLSMIYVTQMNWKALLISAVSVSGFIFGTMSGAVLRMKSESPSLYKYITGLIFIIFITVFSLRFFAVSMYSDNFTVFMISFSMGVLNGCFNKVGVVGIHPTYVTGMTTSCIGALLKNTKGDNSKKTLFFAVLSFVSGALTGGFLSVNYHFAGFSAALILLFAALLCSPGFKQ